MVHSLHLASPPHELGIYQSTILNPTTLQSGLICPSLQSLKPPLTFNYLYTAEDSKMRTHKSLKNSMPHTKNSLHNTKYPMPFKFYAIPFTNLSHPHNNRNMNVSINYASNVYSKLKKNAESLKLELLNTPLPFSTNGT